MPRKSWSQCWNGWINPLIRYTITVNNMLTDVLVITCSTVHLDEHNCLKSLRNSLFWCKTIQPPPPPPPPSVSPSISDNTGTDAAPQVTTDAAPQVTTDAAPQVTTDAGPKVTTDAATAVTANAANKNTASKGRADAAPKLPVMFPKISSNDNSDNYLSAHSSDLL